MCVCVCVRTLCEFVNFFCLSRLIKFNRSYILLQCFHIHTHVYVCLYIYVASVTCALADTLLLLVVGAGHHH